MIEHRGTMEGGGRRFALVASRFSRAIAQQLVSGAHDALVHHGVAEEDIETIWVPGSFELPLAARMAADGGGFDAIIGLGCIIRGQTHHNELIAREVAAGFSRIGQETGIPVILGVITAETAEQAIERAGIKSNGRGWEAAVTAIEMANLTRTLGESRKKK